ncbi:hypothetical protein Q7C36_009411 [Tachysurus vachellii]|uniref:Metalloendopeptidase n=1 Tax=Tachysurus vachellii TaxID=175792 RepID=A0AA88MY58_TACVA|nr:hypothetical protein Q7C36_009411 [Tachysurus vachellii]
MWRKPYLVSGLHVLLVCDGNDWCEDPTVTLTASSRLRTRLVNVMSVWKVIVSALALLLCSVTAHDELSVGELIERANVNVRRDADEPDLVEGDIAVPKDTERNADPCTSNGCMWPKSTDGKVYVPYVILNHYSSNELQVIQRGLDSFASFSCIRFVRRSNQRDYISIESRNGCYSYVGRRGYGQTVSLARSGCVYHKTVQHELLHALGFNHEQTRSDRDTYIRVGWENIQSGMEHNFNKIATLNQGTVYDYNSVMQYHRTAFSKNGQPTMIPIPNPNVSFGQATQMSQNDITRLNRLYKCSHYRMLDVSKARKNCPRAQRSCLEDTPAPPPIPPNPESTLPHLHSYRADLKNLQAGILKDGDQKKDRELSFTARSAALDAS